ncbi:hypothetical protein GCM10020001_013780 [Nonomuraea salmonea]
MSSDWPVLRSAIEPGSEAYKSNAELNERLAAELLDRLATAALGGPERSRRRHVERGKLLPRDRVDGLLDPGSRFLELSPLAAGGLYDDQAPPPPASSPASAASPAANA